MATLKANLLRMVQGFERQRVAADPDLRAALLREQERLFEESTRKRG